MPPHVPFPVHRVRNSLGRMPSRIMVTKATVARQHVRNALLDRVVMAVPYHVASAAVYHRAPRCIPIGLTGWNVEAKCRRHGGDLEHQSNDSFHLDSPDIWVIFRRRNYWRIETNQLVDNEDRLLPSISSKPARTDDGACSRDQTPRGERAHAVGAHVAEGNKPYLKFIWRDVIFQRCRRCPFGQPREAPSPASPALGR